GPAKLDVSLSAVSGKKITVDYAVTGGTAQGGRDYLLKNGTLTFNPGETVKAIEMELNQSPLYDDDKTVEVGLSKPVNAALGTPRVNTYTIMNTVPMPKVTFSSPSQDVKEDAGTITVTAQLSAASGKDVVVPFTVGGTAREQGNYRILTPSPLVIKAGTTNAAVRVALIDNGVNEEDKTVVVAMGMPSNAALGQNPVHTLTIEDTDPAPAVTFALGSSSGKAGEGPAKLDVSLSAVSGKKITVDYAVTGGTAQGGRDYLLKNGTLTFNPGETVKAIEMELNQSPLYDDDKTVEVGLSKPVNAALGTPSVNAFTIMNTVPMPKVTFSAPSQDVKEDAGTITVTAQLSAASGKDVVVPFTVGGTAREQGNYRILTPSPLVIKAGMTNAAVRVALIDNGVNEEDKTVVVAMGMPSNAALGQNPVHTLTIEDTDPAPAVTFALGSSSGKAGEGPAKLDVSLSAVSGKKITVDYAVTGGTAQGGRDYLLKNGTLTFNPGETVKAIEMELNQSPLYDDDKTVEVGLSKPVNAALGTPRVNTYTIMNTVPMPKVTFSSPSQDVKEDAGTITVTAQLSAASGKDVVVPFTVGGTAREQGNYRILTPSPLVIKAGTTNAAVRVALIDNGVNEEDKTVVVAMGMPSNAALGQNPVHTLTIEDTDPAPAVTFALGSSSGKAGEGPAKLDVSLSAVSGKKITVDYAVTGGTAQGGRDYLLKNGTLTFNPGETVKAIEVGINQSPLYDDDKTVEVGLSKPVNAALGTPSVNTYTIMNTVPMPKVTFSAPSQDVKEDAGTITVTAQLSAASGKDVVVPFTVGGTAREQGNYRILTPSPLVIKAGTTNAAVQVALIDNGVNEEDKTLVVAMGMPSNAAVGQNPVHTLTIEDTDPAPAVTFALGSSSGKAGAGPAKLDVSLSAVSGKKITVDYAVTGGTAQGGRDYLLKNGTLTFNPGETVKAIEVGINQSPLYDDDKTVK